MAEITKRILSAHNVFNIPFMRSWVNNNPKIS